MYEQVLNKVTPEYKDKVSLYKVNIEEEPEIAGLFRVMSVPNTTTKYFLDGLILKKIKKNHSFGKFLYIYIIKSENDKSFLK